MAQILIKTIVPLPKYPLPLYSTQVIAETTIEKLGVCDVITGLSKDHTGQLIARTLDTEDEALRYTSDRERFFDFETYERWYKRGRTPYVLIHCKTGDLMALMWTGAKILDEAHAENWYTVGYRSYPPYRGKGFMTSFARYVLECSLKLDPTRNFWIAVAKENQASMALAEKLEFKKAENVPCGDDEIIMILEK